MASNDKGKMNFWTASQAARAWKRPKRTVGHWLEDGKIPTAIKVGDRWLIPRNTPRPKVPKAGRPRKTDTRV